MADEKTETETVAVMLQLELDVKAIKASRNLKWWAAYLGLHESSTWEMVFSELARVYWGCSHYLRYSGTAMGDYVEREKYMVQNNVVIVQGNEERAAVKATPAPMPGRKAVAPSQRRKSNS